MNRSSIRLSIKSKKRLQNNRGEIVSKDWAIELSRDTTTPEVMVNFKKPRVSKFAKFILLVKEMIAKLLLKIVGFFIRHGS